MTIYTITYYWQYIIFKYSSFECSENEKKATEEFNKINEGMKEYNEQMAKIASAKKEKDTALGKIYR